MLEKIEEFFEKKWEPRILGVFLIFFFFIFSFPAFYSSGHIVFGDIDFGFIGKGYIDRIFPLWNETWSTATFFNGTRLPVMGILYNIFLPFLENHPSILVKLLIFLLLFISGISMFFLVNQILKFDIRDGKLTIPQYLAFIISVFAGIYYAYNPWSIMRIQHLFLLVGYALLPLIFYELLYFSENELFKKAKKQKILYHIIFAGILYAVAIGAVHYLFFTFFFILSWYLYRTVYFLGTLQIKTWFKITGRYLFFGVIFLALIMYWIIPYLGASTIASVNPPSINTIDSITNLARYSTYKHILYLVSYWWPMIDLRTIGTSFWLGGGFILFTIFVGNLLNLRNKYVFFFLSWSIILVVLSSGTHAHISDFYKWLVFDNPVAGQAGFIFRDANKLVGLLAFTFAILWGTGTASIANALLNRKKKSSKEEKLLIKLDYVIHGIKSRFKINWFLYYFIFFLSISGISYFYYVKPFYSTFVNHFYDTIPIPLDYKKLIEYQKNDISEEKYLYYPRYEGLISPGYQFGVADWNRSNIPKRPTSSFDIYSTVKHTYNPLEGATTYLGNFYSYIDYYLENNKGYNLGKYLGLVNVGKFVFHNDLEGLHEYYNKQLDVLSKQKEMSHVSTIGFFDIFEIKNPVGYSHLFKRAIYNFSGMSSLETLFNLKGFNYKAFSNIFVTQDYDSNTWKKSETTNDIIFADNKYDIIFSQLDKENFLYPFDFNNYSDGISRWAKMRMDVPDWKWHLKKLKFNNWPWDFGLNHGFVYTYSPAMVDLEPYVPIHNLGKDILDFKSIIDTSEIFTPSNEDTISIGLAKTSQYDEIPAIKGQIGPGDSNIRRAGVMKSINVKEKMGYVFELTVSGKGVSNIHGKIRFLDKEGKEIGVDYASAPRFGSNFDVLKFSGKFVTPAGTEKIGFQLNSLEQPEKNVYWWIHDIKLKELTEYTKPNIQRMKYDFKEKGDYLVFLRAFYNRKGGEVEININGKHFVENLKSENINQFKWTSIGQIDISEVGEKEINFENVEGFNVINTFVFIKKDEYLKYIDKFNDETLFNAKQVLGYEVENDFDYIGNIQSDKNNIDYSNGKTINLVNGKLFRNISILKKSNYDFRIKLNNLAKGSNLYSVTLKDKDGYNILSKSYTNIYDEYININNIELVKGDYNLTINISDKTKSLFNTYDLRRYIKEKDSFEVDEDDLVLQDEKGCSFNAGLPNNVAKYSNYLGKKVIKLNRGFSCYWLVTTNDVTKVDDDSEYLLMFDLKKENTNGLHVKIKFFDNDKKYLDYFFIRDFDNKLTYTDGELSNTQRIINIPKGVGYAQLNILNKQTQEFKTSHIEISNLYFKKYSEIAGIDSIIIYDNEIDFSSDISDKEVNVSMKRDGKMSRNIFIDEVINNNSGEKKLVDDILKDYQNKNINIDENLVKEIISKLENMDSGTGSIYNINKSGLLQIGESYTKLWQLVGSGYTLEPIISNIFLNGYIITPKETDGDFIEVSYLPKNFMNLGYGITIGALLLIILYFIFLFFSKIKKLFTFTIGFIIKILKILRGDKNKQVINYYFRLRDFYKKVSEEEKLDNEKILNFKKK